MSMMKRRGIEERKIDCVRQFFDEINRKIARDNVQYDVLV
jgi:type III restriction enzyme